MIAFWEAIGHPSGRDEEIVFGVPEPMLDVEAPMAAAFAAAVSTLRKAGVPVRGVDIDARLARLIAASDLMQAYDAARHHGERFKEHGDRLQDLADLVRSGQQIPAERYEAALREVAAEKEQFRRLYADTPVMLVPAATGPAPRGFATTGDPRMNAPWTALGTPAISIPLPVGDALPLGLQLTADHGQDARVLRSAVRLHRVLSR
jgi:Asp-tRNA(Asn)/Glu-tRNA(Gln) amidotransferase A subunit family amidase